MPGSLGSLAQMAACMTRPSWTICQPSLMEEALQHQQLVLHQRCNGRFAVLAGLQPSLICHLMGNIAASCRASWGETLPLCSVCSGKTFTLIALYSDDIQEKGALAVHNVATKQGAAWCTGP